MKNETRMNMEAGPPVIKTPNPPVADLPKQKNKILKAPIPGLTQRRKDPKIAIGSTGF